MWEIITIFSELFSVLEQQNSGLKMLCKAHTSIFNVELSNHKSYYRGMISADRFKWDKGFGRANASELGFKNCFCPDYIDVESPLTGKIVNFKLNEQEAIDAESWDGEFRILRSEDKRFAIKVWNY